AQDLEASVGVLDESGAALDPVAVIAIGDTGDFADFRMVYVAADHAVDAALGGRFGDGLLEARDVLDRVLDPQLEISRERPIRKAEALAYDVDPMVGAEGHVVGPVAQEGEPAGVAHDHVELVAMHHEKAAAVCGRVDGLAHHLDLSDAYFKETPQ